MINKLIKMIHDRLFKIIINIVRLLKIMINIVMRYYDLSNSIMSNKSVLFT